MTAEIDVLLFGLGAIGSFYAFILSKSPRVRVTVVARSNYEAVKSNGLRIESENHGRHTVHPHRVLRNPEEADTVFDYVVCANKAVGQDRVAAALKPVVDERTTLVVIQNGVGNEEPFRKEFPSNTIITCVVGCSRFKIVTDAKRFQTWVGARQPSPGHIQHWASENTQLGLFPANAASESKHSKDLDVFESLLKEGNTPYVVEKDMQIARWSKVVWNVAWNSITSLTLVDTHAWLKTDGAMDVTRRVMAEVIKIARVSGVQLEDSLIDELIEKILAMQPIYSSMHADRVAGRPMELDMILGYPVAKAKEFSIDVPVLQTLHSLLLAIDSTHGKS
ncbi:Ketopantoate reductase PanE/ApbA-like protein 1 [Elsinoe fawcettii]|nr:Ketopantoate reductase PanE/ApbA-like protein 1 [Elsinoe fawcettii]